MEPKGQFTTERVFDAPLATVWKAWTDPTLLKQWWGPHNVSIPECEVDLQVGGKFHIVMEAGEAMGPYAGTLWPMLATFTEVEPEAKLAFEAEAWTEGQKETTTIEQTTEVTFSEQDGKTVVKINAVIHNAGSDAGMAVQGMEAGFNQQLDKFTAFLAEQK